MTRKKLASLVLVVGGLAGASLTCSPGYLVHAGLAEGKILSRRRPIEQVVRDPATDPEVRRKLDLVLQARTFASEALGLDVGDSYTTFSRVDSDTLLLVLSAARPDAFEQVSWWFPIVGHMPYKGFFQPQKALDAAAKLRREGYDTYVRPSAAFSTLGFFNDPMLSTLLRYDDVQIVATVIHELTHNTIFVPSQVAFNESFASFVGDRGAIEFFCALEGPQGERCVRARQYWADNLVFGHFLQNLLAELESVYARPDLSRQAKLERKTEVLEAARVRYRDAVLPMLLTHSFRRFDPGTLNNASLIARRLYFDRLERFEAAFEAERQDLPRTVEAIRARVEDTDDPYAALERIVAGAAKLPAS